MSFLISIFFALNDLTIQTNKISDEKKIACDHDKHLNATDATIRFEKRNART